MVLEEEILQTDLGSVSKESGLMEDRKTVAATGLGKRCREVLRKPEKWREDEKKGRSRENKKVVILSTASVSESWAILVCFIHAVQ